VSEKLVIWLCVVVCTGPAAIGAGQESLVIKAGAIWTGTGDTIADGVIVVTGDKIRAVGTGISAPEGARVLEFGNQYVMPGMVDAHSHLGLSLDVLGEIEETVAAIAPEMRILDAYDPFSRDVARALQSGVTTVLLAPGYRSPITGQMAVVKLAGRRDGTSIANPNAGIKFSLGTAALASDRRPTSRAGLIALLREELDGAKAFEAGGADLRGEILSGAVNGQLPVHLFCSSVDEILAAIELADSYKLDATLVGAREADELATTLAERGIATVYMPTMLLSRDKDLKRVGALAEAGVKVAFASMAPKTDPGDLRASAAIAVKYGMSRETALRAITVHPAEILGVAERLGSIEPGKDADLVILSGDPMELTSRVELVIANGNIVYRREAE
jgi:imidazolonepropionase-like amidohydrolase